MVEEFHSDELLDRIIVKADLPSGGAYNTAGTYPHEELVRVLLVLSEETGTPVPELLDAFGRYLVPVFKSKFPRLFEKHRDPLDFLAEVDGFVHVEVRKLYPEAELPRFICQRPGPNELHMDYLSSRHLEDLANGLIRGTLDLFGDGGSITRSPVRMADGADAVRFTVTLDRV